MLTGYSLELNEIEGVTQRERPKEQEKTKNTDALADLFIK